MKTFVLNNKSVFFIVILCLPLLFINVKDSHDWGDDFAQYFLQARNIAEQRTQSDNGLIFDPQPDLPQYEIKAYPVGFPLMLAAVWQVHGYSIRAFSCLISVLMIGFAALSFLYLKKFFPSFLSLILVLSVVYNPVLLHFKKEILSDIPFSFFLLFAVLLFQKKNKNVVGSILTGVLFGWVLSVRGIGAVLFLALAAWVAADVFFKIKERRLKAELSSFVVFISGIVVYFFINAVLYPISSNGFFGFYAQAFHEENVTEMVQNNLNYYYDVLKYFFGQGEGIWFQISLVTRYVVIYGFLIGMPVSWKRKFGFDDLVFIVYAMVILIYPYQAGGFRFLIPIIPFFLKYTGIGMKASFDLVRLPKTKVAVPLIVLLVFFQNVQGMTQVVENQRVTENGPQGALASNMLEFIQNNLPDSAVIAFAKPRALTFYTGKKAAFFSRKLTVEQLHGTFQRMNTHYFLVSMINPELIDRKLMDYISRYKIDLRIIWENEEFTIYMDNAAPL